VSAARKEQLRKQFLAARRAVPVAVRHTEAAALISHVAMLVQRDQTVCAYVPVGSEPGSTELLDALTTRGARVLLPISRTDPDGTPQPLWWGPYVHGQLRAASFGLFEPAGTPLPPATVSRADTVLVPALAVDRHGVRLGRGAGFYDRSLPWRNPVARLIAVVRDTELVQELPGEPHDVRMTHALTPGRGLVSLQDAPGMPRAE
jgi:5-formyltetrahydrofolate cyclo-ligase